MRFYARSRRIIDEKGYQYLALKSGGSNPHPHMECYGPHSAIVAAYLRDNYGHQPTRLDHALDLHAKGVFQRLLRYVRQLCKRHRLKLSFDGDWNTADAGRTIYVGSRSSQVFVRIYEKGLKYAKDVGEPITDLLREWVRVELEFKPQTKEAKALAPAITGEQMWGSCDWTRLVASEVLGMETQRVVIREKRESETERALRNMGSQYARHLAIMFKQCQGDFGDFGRVIANYGGFEDAEDFDQWLAKRFPDAKI